MSTEPKPCTFKGCKVDKIHHHYGPKLTQTCYCGSFTPREGNGWLQLVSARVTKSARIAALTAENAALIAGGKADAQMIASLKSLLAVEAKPPTVVVTTDSAVVEVGGSYAGFINRAAANLWQAFGPRPFTHLGNHATQAEAVAAIVAAWQRVQA